MGEGTGKNEFWASKSYLQWPARKFFSLCPGLAVVTTWEVQHEIPLDLLLQRVVLSIGKEIRGHLDGELSRNQFKFQFVSVYLP